MAVLWAILAYVVLYPVVALGICVGAVLLFGKPTKAKPAPAAPKARNRSGPAPRAAMAPAPGYIPRWNGTRKWQAKEDLAKFEELLNG